MVKEFKVDSAICHIGNYSESKEIDPSRNIPHFGSYGCYHPYNGTQNKLACLSAKELIELSYCLCICNSNGYILSSDSRNTIKDTDNNVHFDDNYKKIIYLPKMKNAVIIGGLSQIFTQ